MNDLVYKNKRQKRFLIAFVILLDSFFPLSSALYLPALPSIAEHYGVSNATANLTLVAFFLTFTVALLIWGPLSDRYGRKPILFFGMIIFMIGCFFCATAPSIEQLVFARVIQAAGASGAVVVCSAIVKDVFVGKSQQNILALIQSITSICPIVAPVLGAFILTYTSWRGTFYLVFGIGVAVFVVALFYKETLVEKTNTNILNTFARLGVVVKNTRFNLLLIIFAVPSLGFMAFPAAAPYIYQNDFGTSSQVFSYYHAIVSIGMLIAPLLFISLNRAVKNMAKVICYFFVFEVVSSLMICLFGQTGPMVFTLLVFGVSVGGGLVRPAGMFMMLNIRKDDTGAASSLIGSVTFFSGTIGMSVVTLFSNYIWGLGFLFLFFNIIATVLWFLFFRNSKLSGEEQSQNAVL